MGHRSTIRTADAVQLMRLLGDVRACSDSAEQGRVLVDGVAKLVNADTGWFVESGRKDGVWIPLGMGTGSKPDPRMLQYAMDWGREYPIQFDVMAASITADARPSYVRTWDEAREGAPRGQLEPFVDLVSTLGVSEMADPVFCLNGEHRFALNLQRIGTRRRRFSARELALLELTAAELRWLHETGRLKLSALTRSPIPRALPPRLEQILGALLEGDSPKQIAFKLHLSIHTVREHITRLYRHYNVTGREELTAMFIKRRSGDPIPPANGT